MREGDILVWDLGYSTWPVRPATAELDRKDLDALWSDLADDALKAQRAVQVLAAAPAQAVPMLRQRLRPATVVDDKRIEQWLTDLDSDDFSTRQSATRELASLYERIEPRLRRALQDRPSLEMRRRLEQILETPYRLGSEALRLLRSVAVLERIGTAEARRILEKLSDGVDARETRAAKAALVRLQHRSPSETGRTSP